jgi:ethanolamine ammonia-lyase small subunit
MVTENPWTSLRELTAARIALGRAGHSLPTRELLSFQLAHARARDSVHRALDVRDLLAELSARGLAALTLHSAARDRTTYLRRPDLGRRLDSESAARLTPGGYGAAIAIADGLSATAVHRHALVLLDALLPALSEWRLAPIAVIEQGRVAVADEIGERLGANLAVMLIGERPGLSSPDSLGAYLTWSPRAGRTDAERNCVSNIRTEGLAPDAAARRIALLMQTSRTHQVTGVGLNRIADQLLSGDR